jgi:hypothetical protein
MSEKMRLSSHMSRKDAGPGNHNSRTNFKGESLNIDAEKSKNNYYWNCITGTKEHLSFKKVEEDYYKENYTSMLDARNENYKKNRHPENCRTMEEYMQADKTKPEEHIIQVGDMNNTITKKQLHEVLVDYYKWHTKTFPNVKFLDIAIHVDEKCAPHIHMRRVWECTGKYGKEICESKALKEMGIKRPDPNKEEGKDNNAKMTYTAMVRNKLLDICIAHGIDIETEVKDGGAIHLQPTEFKLKKMKEEIEENYRLMTKQQLQIKEFEQMLEHSSSELKHLNDRLNVVREDTTKAKSEYQILHDQLQTTMNAVKEAERTKRTITEENKELTEVLDTQRQLLNQAREAVRAVENFVYGYDKEFTTSTTLIERFCSDYKKKNGIDLLPQYNSFVEREKKAAEEIDRIINNLPDFDVPQTDDGYDY